MLDRELIKKLDMKDRSVWLATWGGCGLVKKAPGTWGTLGALPFGLAMLHFGGWALLLMATVVIFWFGYDAADKFEKMSGEHDAGAIVVDEVVGMWLTLLVAPVTIVGVVLAFAAFRFFDIVKPWPVSYFDEIPGAMGVMLDDVMAGIYAGLCLWGWQYLGII